ncbi:hypothetical protein C8R21_1398 [Nitrosospira multiformis]|uniref:Uncharacterized protein n=1 Tax=Nitrosospira multiformis TaxID=1231 RepID=A0A2T5I551_9PROT|nr:hypothetical protein C8R21_1398 [Nitrosospira multiformis]
MRRVIVSTIVALFGTGVVILGFAALLRHTVFFYTADGYMSPQTAVIPLHSRESARPQEYC